MLAYLWFRFEWQYGIGAISALIHDVPPPGPPRHHRHRVQPDQLAAVLTIMGYSLNDTVVIYDRVRENLRRFKARCCPSCSTSASTRRSRARSPPP
ncbi:MAG: hypothetical protein U1E17_14640 [Geminicoccaceae bacterium]